MNNIKRIKFSQEIVGQVVESAESVFTRDEIMNATQESVEQLSDISFFFVKQKTAYEVSECDWSFRRVLFRSRPSRGRTAASPSPRTSRRASPRGLRRG